jgi:penicillin-binding protein-related factor A (putative recombinase)
MTNGSKEMTIAKLDEAQLAKLRATEKEMGIVLVALQPQYSFADLNEQQLEYLRKLEQELGVVLLAYQQG